MRQTERQRATEKFPRGKEATEEECEQQPDWRQPEENFYGSKDAPVDSSATNSTIEALDQFQQEESIMELWALSRGTQPVLRGEYRTS